jgi:hypothetical protein
MIEIIKINGKTRLKDVSKLISIEDMKIWGICDAYFHPIDLSIEELKTYKKYSTKRNTLVIEIEIKKKLRYLIVQYFGMTFFCKSCGFLTIPGDVVFVDKRNRNISFCISCIEKVRRIR